jgi:hypothetical protein
MTSATGTVKFGAEKVAAGALIAVQVVPEAAAAEPGAPTPTAIVEVGNVTDSIGKALEFVWRTK